MRKPPAAAPRRQATWSTRCLRRNRPVCGSPRWTDMTPFTPELRNRFNAWLSDRPDDSILRKLFAVMIAGTVTVLALDYLELSGLREQIAASIPDISTDAAPAGLPDSGEPTIGPLRKPDGLLAA